MPHLDDADLDHLAALARLDLDPSRRDGLRADLEKVLGYVERLADFDDPSVAPLRHPAHDGAPQAIGALRRDAPEYTDGALDATLDRRDGRIVVPRTIDANG